MGKILILDIGFGNIRSIYNAIGYVSGSGHSVELSKDPNSIPLAERIIINGVGSFPECRRKLDNSGLLENLLRSIENGKPLLGICVGMQILATKGLEFKPTLGLNIIPGLVRKFKLNNINNEYNSPMKLPHVGWNKINEIKSPLFSNIDNNSYLYFVHSYVFQEKNHDVVVAKSKYGENFTSAVLKDNVFGVQFHPERSGEVGLKILENFIQWKP